MAAPHSPADPSPEQSIGDWLQRAHGHWQAGQADQAELYCQKVLAVWPGQSDALYLLGLMAHAYGNLDLAIQHLHSACQAPRAPAVYYSDLAEMCRQRGWLTDAERAGRRAVALNASLVAGWNNLGIILQEAGKLDESLTCLEMVVRLQPDYVEAHNNLGNTLKRLGRLGEAQARYQEALSRHPGYAEAHSNLANLFNDLGRFDEAVAEARQAIELNPALADAYINLAGIESSRYHYAEALRWLDALLSFAPRHAGGLAARALTLKQLDRLEEALFAARQAVDAAPQSAEAHNSLGQIQQGLGLVDDALSSFDQAARLPGLAAESALSNRAVLFMETGRVAEAETAFDQALAAFPSSAQLHFNRADLHKFTADDPAIARMEQLLLSHAQSHADRLSLHFALGKAYLDVGGSDRAFQYLTEGNRLKRSTLIYDPDATSAWMRRIADRFPASDLTRPASSAPGSRRPIFVVGMPRSGTSLVEQILASHPAILGAGELAALPRLVDGLRDFPDAMTRLQDDDLAALGEAYLSRVDALGDGQAHVVDKMPSNFLYLGLIRRMLPEARIIHCRRDPVDTCLSCYSKLFTAEQLFAYDLGELGRFHRDYQGLMAHWRAVLPADRFLEIDYEAVVEDLEGETRRLLDFLGLPWSDRCLRFFETPRTVRTASVNQVRQPLYASAKGRWKAHAAHLQPLLAALGSDHAVDAAGSGGA